MMNPIILDELVKIRHQELLKEAEHWQEISRAKGKRSEKVRVIQLLRVNFVKLIVGPMRIAIKYLKRRRYGMSQFIYDQS